MNTYRIGMLQHLEFIDEELNKIRFKLDDSEFGDRHEALTSIEYGLQLINDYVCSMDRD